MFCIVFRVVASVQRQMVMAEFTPEFNHKLQDFYKRFSFPAELKSMKKRCVFLCLFKCHCETTIHKSMCVYPPLLQSLHINGSLCFIITSCVHCSLCIRTWDDVLLTSVLKGQNVSGVRKDKGKKNVLAEQISIVLLRTELLQRQHRYKMD